MKKALCVGINDYPVRDCDLKGCVNDANAWAGVLHEHYGFAGPDITTLLDKKATKANILGALDKMLASAQKGDVLVFTNSSHGTYVADTDGDETRYDEAMCPWDMKKNLIVDDELRTRFHNIPPGVRMFIVSDSCFSGTVTRGESHIDTPDDRRRRFVNPARIGRREIGNVRVVAHPVRNDLYPETKMKEILLSGCTDKQYSYDARFGNVYHGAMSYFALDIIKAANYHLTWAELWDKLVVRLDREGYDQEPQVEGKTANKHRPLFA